MRLINVGKMMSNQALVYIELSQNKIHNVSKEIISKETNGPN